MSSDKYYYDENKTSAAFYALDSGEDGIYELLVSKGVCIGPNERLDEIPAIESDESKKLGLRKIHRKYFKDANLKHLMNLNSSYKLSHEASFSDRREYLRLIADAFEDWIAQK